MATLSMQKVSAPGASRGRRDPRSWTVQQLAELDDTDLLRIVRSEPRAAKARVRATELLVSRYRNLVLACVQRYSRSPELTEDLVQVGYVGLLKAINNFDPAVGGSLAAYGQPCIAGEIKRHFRDKRWQAHVKRPIQELVLQVRDATERLTQQLGHTPSDAELAEALGTNEAQVRQARLATLALQPWSLDAPLTDHVGAATLADVLGQDDPNIERMLNLRAVAAHWDELPRREQRILAMRFYGNMTQAQIGAHFGISQMQVSRLLAHALGYLRERVLGQHESHASPAA